MVFKPAKKYTKHLSGTIGFIRGDLMQSQNSFSPTFVYHQLLPDINFNGRCLINHISIPKKVINLYISYTLNPQLRN